MPSISSEIRTSSILEAGTGDRKGRTIDRDRQRRITFDLVDFHHDLSPIGVDTMILSEVQTAGMMDAMRVSFAQGHLKPHAIEAWRLDQASNVSDGWAARLSRVFSAPTYYIETLSGTGQLWDPMASLRSPSTMHVLGA